ncbi:MAG TPA: Do family serine endopeptidase [Xanthobacteraceae bacterium]|nr:Do family serine endopeptidase [Xanthobacteraceae bacterium]
MSDQSPSTTKRTVLSARRFALLATAVAGLGAFAVVATPVLSPPGNSLTAPAYAQTAARPIGFADIVEKVKPAVISVRVKVASAQASLSLNGEDMPVPPGSPFEFFFRRFGQPDGQMPNAPRRRNFTLGQGSGFFISADGYAVTNNHVVDKAESVEVTTDDGKTYNAKVIGTDARTDLALIKVEGRGDFPYVRLADQAPRIGDWVLAVGNPFGLGGTVTAGIVSARGRDIGAGPYDDFIQIDAPVNKGNSGGPTFDVDGNVIGVNTAIFSPSGGSVGIAFAIPSETVKSVVAQLKEHGSVTRGWIGVQIQPVTRDIADSLGLKNAQGALVAEPQANGPAAKAGIKSGDVITQVNGEAVKDARTLARRISSLPPGTSVKLTVVRNGKEDVLTLTLGELPKQRQARADSGDQDREVPGNGMPQLGLSLAPASRVAGAGAQGVVVTDVDSDGPAAERGFKTGDVILEVGGAKVESPADISKAVADARSAGKRTILMRVKSGDATRFVALPVGNA